MGRHVTVHTLETQPTPLTHRFGPGGQSLGIGSFLRFWEGERNMVKRIHPVVVAGLFGAASLTLPGQASAASISESLDQALGSPALGFAVGMGVGVLLTAGVTTAVRLARRPRPKHAPRHLRSADARPVVAKPAEKVDKAPSHAATNYEDIAENYVGRASFKERMARRAEGVAATLRERMGSNMMDGVPVIERADGSVGDVGTSWWRRAVGESSLSLDAGFATDPTAPAIPSDFSTSDRDRLVASADRHGAGIARRVALVDEGAYPEHRTLDDISEIDEWERALRSLDEKIASVAPAQDPIEFIDVVGGIESLDEPDNLEPDTAFIPFKTPGGHPEVVDTESYVDYLIEDEFSKNSSNAVRRSSRRFLRLLEGGTQPTSRHLADTSPSRRPYAGKHFSVPQAAEA